MSTKPALKELPVLATDPLRIAKVGTVVWVIAAIPAAVFQNQLAEAGINDAAQVALAGVALGLIGQAFLKRRNRRLAQIQ